MSPSLFEVPTDMNSSLQHVDILIQKGLEAGVQRAVSGNNAQMSKLCQLEFFFLNGIYVSAVCVLLSRSPEEPTQQKPGDRGRNQRRLCVCSQLSATHRAQLS